MTVVALLGDSIFDNKVYVGNDPDVADHLRNIAPKNWDIKLYAVDGSVVQMVTGQADHMAADVSHLIVSVGGNDALSNADVLSMTASNAAEVFTELSYRTEAFRKNYSLLLDTLAAKQLPMALCTVYYPNFPEAVMQRIATMALSSFNDVIISEGVKRGFPLIDLRHVCNERSDYANEIEPSGKGGRKIANVIYELINEHDFSKSRTTVYF